MAHHPRPVDDRRLVIELDGVRIRPAVESAGLEWPLRRVVVNLSPGTLRKEGPGLDLPVAMVVLTTIGSDRRGAHVGAWLCGLVDAIAEKEIPRRPREERQCPPAAVREHEDAQAYEKDARDDAYAPEETAVAVLIRLEQESFKKGSRGRGAITHRVRSVLP